MINPSTAASIRVPSKSSNADNSRKQQDLSDTGTTESASSRLQKGSLYTLLVGDVAVRVAWADAGAAAGSVVETTDPILPANSEVTWMTDSLTEVVHIEAADGSSAYEAWVWKSS